MGYIGRGLNTGQYSKLDSIAGSFDGSVTTFSLEQNGTAVTPSAQNCLISLGGVIQEPFVAFSVTGSILNFSEAPATDDTFFGIVMGEAAFIAGNTVGQNELQAPSSIASYIGNEITGSLGANASLIRSLTAVGISGSFVAKADKSAISGSIVSGVSGSATSTGSFGRVEATRLSGDGADITGLSSFAGAAGTEALISGSSISTGSFGMLQVASGSTTGGTITTTEDGIVGIGTTTPGQNLAGSTGDRTDASLLHIKNGSGHARFILEGNTGASMELVDVTGGSDLKIMQIAVSDDVTSFHSVDDDLAAYKSQNILVLDHDSGNVGIGTASPDGPLHVHASTAGSVTANTNFNDLVLETSAHTGMTIFSGTDSHGAIYFGDSGGNNRGQIKYLHPQDAMTFATADSEAMTIDSNGVEPGAGQGDGLTKMLMLIAPL